MTLATTIQLALPAAPPEKEFSIVSKISDFKFGNLLCKDYKVPLSWDLGQNAQICLVCNTWL